MRPRKIDPLELAAQLAPIAHMSNRQIASIVDLSEATIRRAKSTMDNRELRAFVSLPPKTHQVEPEPPQRPQPSTTSCGDKDLDNAAWLAKLAATGDHSLFAFAKLTWDQKLSHKSYRSMEKRLTNHLAKASGNPLACLVAFGAFDLDELYRKGKERIEIKQEALERFGSLAGVFWLQPPEQLLESKTPEEINIEDELNRQSHSAPSETEVANSPALLAIARRLPDPKTLADIVYELAYWKRLYWIRRTLDGNYMDQLFVVTVRESYIEGLFTKIKPRNQAEATQAFHYIINDEGFDRDDPAKLLAYVNWLFVS